MQFRLNPVNVEESKAKRKWDQFPNSERTKYYVSMVFGSSDDDDDDGFTQLFQILFALFFSSVCGRQLCCCKNGFTFVRAYWSRSNGSTFHRSIRSYIMCTTRLLSLNVCSLCTHFTFDILIKIRFSLWSAKIRKKSISRNENCLQS